MSVIKTANVFLFGFCFGVSDVVIRVGVGFLSELRKHSFKDISKSALWTETYVVIVIYAGIFLE